MSCEIVPRVSSALAAAEFHSLSPPCVHSAETPGPLMPQPGALARGKFIHEGLRVGAPRTPVLKPRMFSASYQRYSGRGAVFPLRLASAGSCAEVETDVSSSSETLSL